MDVLAVLLIAVLLGAVAVFVTAPVRRPKSGAVAAESPRDALEVAKEAKYREIRDAELDYRIGKLSEEDYRALDATLRAEAVEILAKLDALDAG